jgi:hypothetical protein
MGNLGPAWLGRSAIVGNIKFERYRLAFRSGNWIFHLTLYQFDDEETPYPTGGRFDRDPAAIHQTPAARAW